jgi:glucose/arabinose dehydrogenase
LHDSAASGGSGAAVPDESCATQLSRQFRLDFEEIPLDDEPEELTDLKPVPGTDDQLLLLDKQGRLRLYELTAEGGALVDKLELADVYGEDDCGAVSLAFDPAYVDNHFVYVGHCVSGTASRITRLTLSKPFDEVQASAVTIIELGDPSARRPWHNVGSIGFDDDETMWALFGEKAVPDNAQDPGVALGKLLRFVPSREPGLGGYEPAEGNPGMAGDPSVYALGLRSPWRGARDGSGRYWVGDVGSDIYEELNLISGPAQNLGWPLAEGPCQAACGELTDPLITYGREGDSPYVLDDPDTVATASRSIWVAGPFDAAPDDPDPYACNLRGVMLFGDFFTGWVRAASADEDGVLVADQWLGHLRFASAFTQDARGVIYATTLGIYKVHGTDPRGRLYRALPTR